MLWMWLWMAELFTMLLYLLLVLMLMLVLGLGGRLGLTGSNWIGVQQVRERRRGGHI